MPDIRVIADTIYVDGEAVAEFLPGARASLREDLVFRLDRHRETGSTLHAQMPAHGYGVGARVGVPQAALLKAT